MKFIHALKLLFEGKKLRVSTFVEGDHYFIKANKLYFTGPIWGGKTSLAVLTEEDIEDTSWEVLE